MGNNLKILILNLTESQPWERLNEPTFVRRVYNANEIGRKVNEQLSCLRNFPIEKPDFAHPRRRAFLRMD